MGSGIISGLWLTSLDSEDTEPPHFLRMREPMNFRTRLDRKGVGGIHAHGEP